MKVTMKVKTRHQGNQLDVGDKIDVDQSCARRWEKNGIAKIIQSKQLDTEKSSGNSSDYP